MHAQGAITTVISPSGPAHATTAPPLGAPLEYKVIINDGPSKSRLQLTKRTFQVGGSRARGCV